FLDEGRAVLFLKGQERRAHEVLGARVMTLEGVAGTGFAVWAPNARAVNLMGTMNRWEGRCHPMRPRGATGVWELFVPDVGKGAAYKYEIVLSSGRKVDKADPCGRSMELRPATASVVWDPTGYVWGDADWRERRSTWDPDRTPVSVYEVHLGSWKRTPPEERSFGDHGWPTYRQLADDLLPYVKEMGFTHVELLPVLEHPYDQSWGYQPVGFFAPTARFGQPDDFRHFVDRAHQMGIGVILDWVPGHFPDDVHGLARFDGTPLYEHPDPRRGLHPDWGTRIFDYAKPAVRSFILSSALHWLEDYHLDGLRVDAVASLLYLDYSRSEGQWLPNEYGGNENLDAVSFLRELNDAVHQACPGALVIAEESTAWPKVSHGTDRGGLGFDQKWNMGWMNDTLKFMQADPLFRAGQYGQLTFSIMYAFTERFVLPLSHDEVVHGKRSLASKMPGTQAAKLANLRALYAYLWSHPGKKLLFMGGEFAQWTEWNVDAGLDWVLLDFPAHDGVRALVRRLNELYRTDPSLHEQDFHPDGFEWLDCHDPDRTILSYLRWSMDWKDFTAVAVNFTPTPWDDFRLAVPFPGKYRVVLNTDAAAFGGRGRDVPDVVEARPGELHGRDQYLPIPLPGLASLFVKPER
ncbi:MAG TPA: 1,4-alpha-glucan branching protein GlgB, partial [Longimicrobiales bacterium]|nr:1,4-alpha-glucan branching protein GlgB [Longimicrobiales bacterium]